MQIVYHIEFPKTQEKSFSCQLTLNDETMQLESLGDVPVTSPDWVGLEFNKCPHCPLNKNEHPLCPAARSMYEMMEFFKDMKSIALAKVSVQTPERTYLKECSAQEALFPIFGIVMSTSGCPHLKFLRPMTRFHLPFASLEETLYRMFSTFLLEDLVKRQKAGIQQAGADQELFQRMDAAYANVEVVNQCILNRFHSFASGDAGKNAIVILNTFAQMVNWDLGHKLKSLYYIFET